MSIRRSTSSFDIASSITNTVQPSCSNAVSFAPEPPTFRANAVGSNENTKDLVVCGRVLVEQFRQICSGRLCHRKLHLVYHLPGHGRAVRSLYCAMVSDQDQMDLPGMY